MAANNKGFEDSKASNAGAGGPAAPADGVPGWRQRVHEQFVKRRQKPGQLERNLGMWCAHHTLTPTPLSSASTDLMCRLIFSSQNSESVPKDRPNPTGSFTAFAETSSIGSGRRNASGSE